mgnify:CR=1 FL=1
MKAEAADFPELENKIKRATEFYGLNKEKVEKEIKKINREISMKITYLGTAAAEGFPAVFCNCEYCIKAKKLGGKTVGVIFPILSRNRFAICLRGIASGVKKIVLMLSYPSDEVGNHLVSLDMLDEKGVNPYSDVLTLEKYRELFGENKHPFTGIDYVDYYSQIIKENTKLKETVKEQEKLINNLKKEALELGYLLSVKVEELGEKRICIIQR